MSKNLLSALLVAVLVLGVSSVGHSESEQALHHVVLINLKADVTDEGVQSLIKDGKELLSEIPGVVFVTLGKKARENRDVHIKDYVVALYVKLEKNADLDVYAPHPNHQEFLKRHKPNFAGVKVIDFLGD